MTIRGHGLWLAAGVVLLVAACAPAGSQSDGNVGAGAACAWPASLDAPASSSGQCVAGRAYLSCSAADGSGELCLTDDVTQCPGPSATGETYGNCRNLCDADEYAVACGVPGPGPSPPAPAGCRTLPPSPGGGTTACCPCQTNVTN